MPDDIIAQRTYTLDHEGGARIEVSIFKPVPDGDDYKCRYEIREDGELVRQSHAMGIDGLQAMLLAVQALGAEILFSDEGKEGRIYWLGQNDDLGLPVLP